MRMQGELDTRFRVLCFLASGHFSVFAIRRFRPSSVHIVAKIRSTDVPGIGLIISVVAPLDDARGTVMVLVMWSRTTAALTVGHTPLMAHDDVAGVGFTISLVVPLDEASAAVMVQVIRSRAAAAFTMGHTSLMAHDTLATTARNCSHGS